MRDDLRKNVAVLAEQAATIAGDDPMLRDRLMLLLADCHDLTTLIASDDRADGTYTPNPWRVMREAEDDGR